MKFATYYSERKPVMTEVSSESEVKMSEADQVELNGMIKRYLVTGVVPDMMMSNRQAFFADVSEAPGSLIEAYERIKSAEAAFAELPSEVRQNYRDVAEFAAALEDPHKSADIAKSLGIVHGSPDNGDGVPSESKAGDAVSGSAVVNSEPAAAG